MCKRFPSVQGHFTQHHTNDPLARECLLPGTFYCFHRYLNPGVGKGWFTPMFIGFFSTSPSIYSLEKHQNMFKTHLRRITRRPVFNKTAFNDAAPAHVRTGRCVALVDARFLSWLTQGADDRADPQAVGPAAGVLAMLALSLRQAGLEVDVVRVYWYTDRVQGQPVDDLVQRPVMDPETDGGTSLMLAMGGDLLQLAAHHAADHVLVVSDDERLLPAVDQAQLHGLGVHLLMDEAGNDFNKLLRDDPSWARLLAQADRRVLMLPMTGGAVQPAQDSRNAEPVDSADMHSQVTQELQAWWDEEPETQRMDLQDELRHSRSIPQEVDRQLLLRLSRNLGHPLSWPEKKAMRESVRRIVLGDEFTPYKSDPTMGGNLASTDGDTEPPASWRVSEESVA